MLRRVLGLLMAIAAAAFGTACGDSGGDGATGTTGSGGATTTSATTGAGGGSGGGETCAPGKILRCEGTVLLACDDAGKVAVAGDCTDLGRICVEKDEEGRGLLGCYECDPNTYVDACSAAIATFCNADGILQTATCTGECKDGICCVDDADGDGLRNCDGDCDDSDADVHPGQTEFFYSASEGGTFDYDCNGDVELKWDMLGTCGCCWLPPESSVPNCGGTGKFRICDCGSSVCADTPSQTQACR